MNEEVWAELTAHSRRMARIEIALTERILALEAEVRALKGETQPGREIYPDARQIEWRDQGAAIEAITRIMDQ